MVEVLSRQAAGGWGKQEAEEEGGPVHVYNIIERRRRMPKVVDKYVLEDKIGHGQFGEVYRGRHQDSLEVVAIKTIKRDMIKGTLAGMQASSTSCSRTRSRCSRPATTPTSSSSSPSRKPPTTTTSCSSTATAGTCWHC
jgi:hypothetical protein